MPNYPQVESNPKSLRPDPGGMPGHLFHATDTLELFRDSGAAWVEIARAPEKMFLSGALASRPAAGIKYRIFVSTDENKIYLDDGVAWVDAVTIPAQQVDTFTEIVDVKQFGGATGDGIANDTAAVNASVTEAISRKGILYFPQGTYLIDGITLSTVSNLMIRGAGPGLSVLKKRVVNGPTAPVINILSSDHIVVKDLTINGNRTTEVGATFNNDSNAGIKAVGLSDSLFENLEIIKIPSWCVSIRPTVTGSKNLIFDNIVVDDTARWDMGANGTENVWMNSVRFTNFHDTSAEGLVIDQGGKKGFWMTNCRLEGTTIMPAIGMTLRGGPEAYILNNFFFQNREGNITNIEIGEDQQRTFIAGNRLDCAQSAGAIDRNIAFATGVNDQDDFVIANNIMTNAGGNSTSAFIGTDRGNIQNIIIVGNRLLSTAIVGGFLGDFIRLVSASFNNVIIANNIMDASLESTGLTFVNVEGDNGICSDNMFLGGSAADTGILFAATSDNWVARNNVFKNVDTKFVVNGTNIDTGDAPGSSLVMLDGGINKVSRTTAVGFTDVDISLDTGADTATHAVLQTRLHNRVSEDTGLEAGWLARFRKNGSTATANLPNIENKGDIATATNHVHMKTQTIIVELASEIFEYDLAVVGGSLLTEFRIDLIGYFK